MNTILAGQTDRQRGKSKKTFTDRLRQTDENTHSTDSQTLEKKVLPNSQQMIDSKRGHIQINLRWTNGLTDVVPLLLFSAVK